MKSLLQCIENEVVLAKSVFATVLFARTGEKNIKQSVKVSVLNGAVLSVTLHVVAADVAATDETSVRRTATVADTAVGMRRETGDIPVIQIEEGRDIGKTVTVVIVRKISEMTSVAHKMNDHTKTRNIPLILTNLVQKMQNNHNVDGCIFKESQI